MGIKSKIAAWLAPEMADHARRYRRLRGEINDAHRWLGEFPLIIAIIDWLRVSEQNYYRGRDVPPVDSKWRAQIHEFREQLRSGEPK